MNDTSKMNTFQLLNRKRIERLSSLLPAKQQNFIHLLPLLFHVNSTTLPGYINLEAPAGIVDYQPGKQAIEGAKSYHRAFSYSHRALHRYPIHALYLINKRGLLGYKHSQSFELWLIYAQPISEAQLTLLKQKSAAISKWSQAENLPLTIQLYDEATLLTSDGPTHYDRDLFYCSGLLLAGKPPSWWLGKAQGDRQQQNTHYEKESIDFGPIIPLSIQERFDLVASNLEEALDLGIESCLELVYFDSLLDNPDEYNSLSKLFIQTIIAGETDPMLLDINHLKYTLISQHSADQSALALAQQSLYLKSKESLSKRRLDSPYPWRRSYIQRQIEAWQWPDTQTELLDFIPRNHYRQSLTLFQSYRRQLSASLAKLAAFSQQYQPEYSQRKKQLQHKFDAFFIEQEDTLTRLPATFLPRQAEEYAYLYRQKKSQLWSIDDRESALSKAPLYQHRSLLNVLAWAITNHLIAKVTRLKVADENNTLQTNVIIELVQHLLRTPLSNQPVASKYIHLENTAQIKHILLFANIDCQLNDSLSQHGLEISSSQDDPLNYAYKKQNLISRIEGLLYSDQDQWHYFSFSGNECFLQMLVAILHWNPSALPDVSCWCYFGNHGQNISHRIKNSFQHIVNHFINTTEAGEYLIAISGRLYQLQWQSGLCDFTRLPQKETMTQYLAKQRAEFMPILLDPVLDDGLLNSILSYQAPSQVSLFIETAASQLIIYIIDDRGSLLSQKFNNLTKETLIQHFSEFLSAIPYDGETLPVHFFHISKQNYSDYKISPLSLKKQHTTRHHLPVTIEMDSPDDYAQCTIHCGARRFSGAANESSLFSQVSELLLSLRQSNRNYHLYVTRLTFKQVNVPVYEYLLHKQRLETLLNTL